MFNIFKSKKAELDGAVCEIRLGLPGSGKSLDQTLLAVLPHLLNNEEVYCCYWINWKLPNYHYFDPNDEEAVKKIITETRNAVVVFDEIAQVWEPRSWENESAEVRKFFQLHRHRHVDIYANTQDVSLVAKTVGIVASNWIKCEKIETPLWLKWIKNILGFENKITIDKLYMTYQEVKKEANGWELGEVIEERKGIETKKYGLKDILREDLNDYKIETIHRYCSKCKARQGEQIKKEDNEKIAEYNPKKDIWTLKTKEFCPKHKDELLTLRKTGLYDTDYEIESIQKDIIIKKYKHCHECGYDKLIR